jgi:rubredoxin
MNDLVAKIKPLAKRLADLQRQAKALGLFANDRELLECPHCGLKEDVTCEGRIITYREPDLGKDTGLRFEEITAESFRCPACGQTARERPDEGEYPTLAP